MVGLVFVSVTALRRSSEQSPPPAPRQMQGLPSAQDTVTVPQTGGAIRPAPGGGDGSASRKTRAKPAPAKAVPAAQKLTATTPALAAAAPTKHVVPKRDRHADHCLRRLADKWRAEVAKELAADGRRQLKAKPADDRLGPAVCPQLRIDMVQMVLDRLLAKKEGLRDGGVGASPRHQVHHLALAK